MFPLLDIFTTDFSFMGYSESVNRLLGNLIENREKVLILYKDSYSLVLFYDGKIYEIWTENKFYGYLSKIFIYNLCFSEKDYKGYNELFYYFEDKRPSRMILYKFFKTYENCLPSTPLESLNNLNKYFLKKYKRMMKGINLEFQFTEDFSYEVS